jgi:hypothetical protein
MTDFGTLLFAIAIGATALDWPALVIGALSFWVMSH